MTYADGSTISYRYDFRGNVTQTITADGRVTEQAYDRNGQLIEVTTAVGTPDASTVRYEYDVLGRKVREIDSLGKATTYTYDDANNQIRITDALGRTTTSIYNDNRQLTAQIDALGRRTSYGYGARGFRMLTTYADQTKDQQIVDGQGRVLSIIDQAGKTTAFGYNALGQVTSVTNANQAMIRYSYDPLGNVAAIFDANGHQTSFEYDALGQLLKKTLPDGSFEGYTYDALGNQTSVRRTDGTTVTSEYDLLGRLSRLRYPDGQTTVYTYAPDGLLETVVDARGTTRYAYDQQAQLRTVIQPDGQSITYGYDAAGRRTTVTTAAGTVSYTYDAADQLVGVTDATGSTTTLVYSPTGQRTQLRQPNGITIEYGYNQLDRLTSIVQRRGSDAPFAAYTYTLDPVGNRTRLQEADGSSTDWTYDAAYRLLSEIQRTGTGSVTYAASYTYDPMGNRLSQTVNGQGTSYTYNRLDQLITAGTAQYRYDGRGNLAEVRDGASSTFHRFDAADRLSETTLPDGTSVGYAYDAAGNRIARTVGADVTRYLWDESSGYGDVVLESDDNGAIQASYSYADSDILSMTRGGATSYYLADGQHNIRSLADANGTITDRYRYAAFGELAEAQGTTTNPYQYTSQYRDPLTNLYDLRSRFYNPLDARFLSADTAEVVLERPTELNRYLYAVSNPISFRDPSGFGIYDYQAICEAIHEHTQNAMDPLGLVTQELFGKVLGGWLSVDARRYEKDAVDIWNKTNPYGEKFKYHVKGEIGVGLGVYTEESGRIVPIAAFNDVGLDDVENSAKRDRFRRHYQEVLDIMQLIVANEGYEILNTPQIVDSLSRGAAAHEEDFLMRRFRASEGSMAYKGLAVAGVPQTTICPRCAGNHAGQAGRLLSFLTPLNSGRKTRAMIVGHDFGSKIPRLP